VVASAYSVPIRRRSVGLPNPNRSQSRERSGKVDTSEEAEPLPIIERWDCIVADFICDHASRRVGGHHGVHGGAGGRFGSFGDIVVGFELDLRGSQAISGTFFQPVRLRFSPATATCSLRTTRSERVASVRCNDDGPPERS
jgi:hypothetical protein